MLLLVLLILLLLLLLLLLTPHGPCSNSGSGDVQVLAAPLCLRVVLEQQCEELKDLQDLECLKRLEALGFLLQHLQDLLMASLLPVQFVFLWKLLHLHLLLHMSLGSFAGGSQWLTMRCLNLHINKYLTHGSHLQTT